MPTPIACPACQSLSVIIRSSIGQRLPRRYLMRCACGHVWRVYGTITRSLVIEVPR